MKSNPEPGRKVSRPYMMAVVLGTALTALSATPDASASTLRAVNDISRYCAVCWRNAGLHPGCWSDCTQEVFSRLLDRVTPESWARLLRDESEERRELVRAIDAVKKRTQRGKRWSSEMLDVVADRKESERQRLQEDRTLVEELAKRILSPRQEQIVRLSLDGWSVKEIAEELEIGVERVSDEKYKAIRKLREELVPELA